MILCKSLTTRLRAVNELLKIASGKLKIGRYPMNARDITPKARAEAASLAKWVLDEQIIESLLGAKVCTNASLPAPVF